ncbi:MAG: hypothetical protein ACD_39C01064G0001 [uncultured bacterium]|nr:MAG: hypothetical protein ACD_39C01064G0001 [uncultured bacterium]
MIAHAENEIGAAAVINTVVEVYLTHEGKRFIGVVLKAGVYKDSFVAGVAITCLITAIEVEVATFLAFARQAGKYFPGIVGVSVPDSNVAGRKDGAESQT